MLYELRKDLSELQPVGFVDFEQKGKLEKDLENLLANSLPKPLYESTPLLPFHQEKPYEGVGDIYALNVSGDIVIFELKRSTATAGALDQLLRYAEKASHWTYSEMNRRFANYPMNATKRTELRIAHQGTFDLDEPLEEGDFNQDQHMIVVGSSADEDLMRSIEYWRGRGLPVDFLPYRVYEIGDKLYLEFFAKPYDKHYNPMLAKGVLFDTNRTYDEQAFEHMVQKRRISAFGGQKGEVECFQPGDTVFYSHKGVGIVLAARIAGTHPKADGADELYWDVEFLTPPPSSFDPEDLDSLSFKDVSRITDRKFYWARTRKSPYLSKAESASLLKELRKALCDTNNGDQASTGPGQLG